MEDFGFLQRLIQTLEARGLLDRAVEYLPDDMQLAERRRRSEPFTRPELSVLLAYAKLTLYDDLLESAVPDDPYLARELARYFPKPIAARFPDALEHHRLRREIIATHLGQFDDQSRRSVADRAHRRPDRRRRRPRSPRPSPPCATATA